MKLYSVFGGVLGSELALPELQPIARRTAAAADWELRIATAPAAAGADGRMADDEVELVGRETVTSTIEARLYRRRQGLRLVFDDTGRFDIDAAGRQLVWYAAPGARIEAVRMDVLGRVLPLALHRQGVFTLHGSAVQLGTGAAAFIAPKYHGKSTLARALVAAGGRLLTDDVVAVRLDERAIVVPGVHSMRLRPDTAERFGAAQAADVPPVEKQQVRNLIPAQLATEAVPLTAIYLVSPVPARDAAGPVQRVALPAVDATITLLTQLKLGGLLGGSESERVLRFCAELARLVPVYRLELARDLDLLPAVAGRIAEWSSDELASPSLAAVP